MRKALLRVCVSLYKPAGTGMRNYLRKAIGRLDGGQAFSQCLREIMSKYHGIKIGFGTYGPCFDLTQTWVGKGNMTIGKYCSFARGTCFYSRNHPYWRPSTTPLFFNSKFFAGINEDTVPYQSLEIGNDVWTGQYSLILPSVRKIGNGAVIGAGAVVTKDVPPYAIVAGNPASVIKYRFDKETIAWLEEIKWWDWDKAELEMAIDAFQSIDALRDYVSRRGVDKEQ